MKYQKDLPVAKATNAKAAIILADPRSVGFGKTGSCFKQD